MRLVRHRDRAAAEAAVASEVADLVAARPEAVLGLATGGTMVGVYRALVACAERRGVDFGGVRTFNLDEYLGDVPPALTFRGFMREHLFGPLGIEDARTGFPDVARAAADPLGASRAFEDRIAAAGGIDLQLLGIGGNGHIAFNEPGSPRASRTRVVDLAPRTRADAASTFGGLERVPTRAITMGVSSIMEARALRILALGEGKAEVVARAVGDPVGPACPVTFAREHDDAALHVDAAAASALPGRGE